MLCILNFLVSTRLNFMKIIFSVVNYFICVKIFFKQRKINLFAIKNNFNALFVIYFLLSLAIIKLFVLNLHQNKRYRSSLLYFYYLEGSENNKNGR